MTGRVIRDYPERSVALVRGFGSRLDRALIAGGAGAVVSALIVSIAGLGVVPPELLAIVAALVGMIVGLVITRLTIPGNLLRAFEAYSWLGRAEVDRFQARTGSRVPTNRRDMERWLAGSPSTSAFRLSRVEMLAFVGRYDEALAELDGVVVTGPDLAFERATLAQYIGWLQDGDPRLDELRASAADLPLDRAGRLAADVTIAIAEARDQFMRGIPTWSRPLEDVRARLGRAPTRVVLRDTWRVLATIYLLLGLFAGALAFLLPLLA